MICVIAMICMMLDSVNRCCRILSHTNEPSALVHQRNHTNHPNHTNHSSDNIPTEQHEKPPKHEPTDRKSDDLSVVECLRRERSHNTDTRDVS